MKRKIIEDNEIEEIIKSNTKKIKTFDDFEEENVDDLYQDFGYSPDTNSTDYRDQNY